MRYVSRKHLLHPRSQCPYIDPYGIASVLEHSEAATSAAATMTDKIHLQQILSTHRLHVWERNTASCVAPLPNPLAWTQEEEKSERKQRMAVRICLANDVVSLSALTEKQEECGRRGGIRWYRSQTNRQESPGNPLVDAASRNPIVFEERPSFVSPTLKDGPPLGVGTQAHLS